MTIRRMVFGLMVWLDGRPYRIAVIYLGLLTFSFVPLVLRVGNLFQLWWNPFPKFSESQLLVLGYVYDKLLLIALMMGVAMCVVPIMPLLFGRFRTAAKMFVGMLLALFLTAVVFFAWVRLCTVSRPRWTHPKQRYITAKRKRLRNEILLIKYSR